MSYQKFTLAKQAKLKRWYFIVFLVLVFALLLSLSCGDGKVDFSILSSFLKSSDEDIIFYHIRFPRTLAALFGGALLGVSGALMQGVLKNPLASPYTLGIAQAASFGASFAIIILGVLDEQNGFYQNFSIVGCAFGASMLCMGAILWFGKLTQMKPQTLILAGVALGALFHSLTMLMQFFASDLNAAAALFWTFGDLGKSSWNIIIALSITLVVSVGVLWVNYWKIDALSLGDEEAKSKGVNVDLFRVLVLFVSTFTAALVVAYFGIIGFIGLIAAHLVRLSIGVGFAVLIPFSALYGSVVLMLADTLSKLIVPPVIVPIGIVTAFMGVPLLLYLLGRKAHG